jgi:hypothetical protein
VNAVTAGIIMIEKYVKKSIFITSAIMMFVGDPMRSLIESVLAAMNWPSS